MKLLRRRQEPQAEPVDHGDEWEGLLESFRTRTPKTAKLARYRLKAGQRRVEAREHPPAEGFDGTPVPSRPVVGPAVTPEPPSERTNFGSDPKLRTGQPVTPEPRPLTYREQMDDLQRSFDASERAWREKVGDSRELPWTWV